MRTRYKYPKRSRRGRPRNAVIGTHGSTGEVRRWRDMEAAADDLGTTANTLRVYMCLYMEYKGYSLDYAPSNQLSLF